MIPSRIIEAKRNGRSLAPAELEAFFGGYLSGEVHEYQMAAFLMAVYYRGLEPDELSALTGIMVDSGARLDLSWIDGPRVDKHSTGGVGDKVSLALAPLAAELGLHVPMMSGRGLGHTGGTLDKLEAIPGFRTDLSLDAFQRVLADVGCAMIGQTDEIAPLDRRLYDLRSVTGTVPAIPLIATSIMSKKLAEGLTGLVLDVKVGEGAFIPSEDGALELARTMVGIGESRGVPTVALLTAMDRPLGRAVGNALETAEAIACLRGEGPPDLREIVVALAAEMGRVGEGDAERRRDGGGGPEGPDGPDPDVAPRRGPADAGGGRAGIGRWRERAGTALDDGSALGRFRRLVEAQGGDPAVVDDRDALPSAPVTRSFRAPRGGILAEATPTVLGYGVVELGGGRKALGDAIDPAVGFVLHAPVGREVSEGDVLAVVHAASAADADRGLAILGEALRVTDGPARTRPLVSHRVTGEGVELY